MITKAAPAAPAPVNDHERAIQQAQAEITRLRNRMGMFQSRIQAAAEVGDALTIAECRREYDDLPLLIDAAEMRWYTLEIEAADAAAPAAVAAWDTACSQRQPAVDALAAAQEALRRVDQEQYIARSEVDHLRQRAAEFRRRRADKLAAMTTALAPVVRSLPHAGAVVRNGQ